VGLVVDLHREHPQLGGGVVADGLDDCLVVDVLVVVAQVGLRGRGEDRLGQVAAVLEPGGQRDAADLARTPVVEQSGSGEVAARHALHGEHVELFADHRAPRDGRRHVGRDDVVADQPGQLLEPPQRHPGEDLALVGDRGVEDEVEGRDAVARDHQEPTLVLTGIDPVEVAHLPGVDVGGALDHGRCGDVQLGCHVPSLPRSLRGSARSQRCSHQVIRRVIHGRKT
jgi:hypothetical protein